MRRITLIQTSGNSDTLLIIVPACSDRFHFKLCLANSTDLVFASRLGASRRSCYYPFSRSVIRCIDRFRIEFYPTNYADLMFGSRLGASRGNHYFPFSRSVINYRDFFHFKLCLANRTELVFASCRRTSSGNSDLPIARRMSRCRNDSGFKCNFSVAFRVGEILFTTCAVPIRRIACGGASCRIFHVCLHRMFVRVLFPNCIKCYIIIHIVLCSRIILCSCCAVFSPT